MNTKFNIPNEMGYKCTSYIRMTIIIIYYDMYNAPVLASS